MYFSELPPNIREIVHQTVKKLFELEDLDKIYQAAQLYIDRRDRKKHPSGHFDKHKRWSPNASERCDCCECIRSPSATYPFSLMTHCRTVNHVANLLKVNPKLVKQAIKLIGTPILK